MQQSYNAIKHSHITQKCDIQNMMQTAEYEIHKRTNAVSGTRGEGNSPNIVM